MKKTCIPLILLLSVSETDAQITIGQGDMPSVDDTFRISITTAFDTVNPIDPELTGTNYMWDFSFLIPDSQEVDTFVSVSSTPFSYQFYFNNQILYPEHKASYALSGNEFEGTQIQVTEVYEYYKNDTADYKQVGFGAKIMGLPSSIRYIPVDYIYRFPMQYGIMDSSKSSWGLSIPGLGYYGQTKNRVNTVDGWGTVITPFGTFQALRLKSVINIEDTLYLDTVGAGTTTPRPAEIEYKWLGTGKGIPLLQINAQLVLGVPVIKKIIYLDSLRTGIAGSIFNHEQEKETFVIIQNISNGAVTIQFNTFLHDARRICVYNILGKIVLQQYLVAGTFQTELLLNHLPSGLYMIEVVGYPAQKIILNK